MNRRIFFIMILFIFPIMLSVQNFASEGCPADQSISIPIKSAAITFKDGSIRDLSEIKFEYFYVYESDKRYLNPRSNISVKNELFIGLCDDTINNFKYKAADISRLSFKFEADYSYVPYNVQLGIKNGKVFNSKGMQIYGPLVPPKYFILQKSEKKSIPDITVFRLRITGYDNKLKKTVSGVIFDSADHHKSDIQVMDIQIK